MHSRTLGTLALADGSLEAADQYLRRAYEQDSTDYRTANNLARLDPTRLDEALELVDSAVELVPDDPEMTFAVLETREDILNRIRSPADPAEADGRDMPTEEEFWQDAGVSVPVAECASADHGPCRCIPGTGKADHQQSEHAVE